MAQTYAQICATAAGIAKLPNMLALAGLCLQEVLDDVCQTYDFDVARGVVGFNFQPGLISTVPPFITGGGGPYPLPADYLRADFGDVFFTDQGVPHVMANVDMAQFDRQVQQAGLQSYPTLYATDLSLQNSLVPVMWFYSPPQSNYPVTVRYRRLMPSVASPQTSNAVPWFPSTKYLVTATAGAMMRTSDDTRADDFLGEGPQGAQGIMNRLLKLANDSSSRAKTVKLDPRNFGPDTRNLQPTKAIWVT